jgi:hypothetical protein
MMKRSIAKDEPSLMTDVIAETVIQTAERLVGMSLSNIYFDKAVKHLVDHAEVSYAASDNFAKKIRAKGNKGRDALYVFMEHWLASWLKKNIPEVYRKLPRGYGWDYSPYLKGH